MNSVASGFASSGLQKAPWWVKNCHLNAFAVATGIDREVLLSYLGHDGSEIVFPNEPEPTCRRGFHVQELLYAGFKLGHNFMPLELVPVSRSPLNRDPEFVIEDAVRYEYIARTIKINLGFITGVQRSSASGNIAHAVAFKNGYIVDFERKYLFDDHLQRGFIPQTVWVKV